LQAQPTGDRDSVARLIDALGVGIRWTIGDVSPRGFEALRLSIWGAWRVFGSGAAYAVCVNQVRLAEAQRRCGTVPDQISWRAVEAADLPERLRPYLDSGMAEGVAWKLAPPRLFPDRWELSLDNDCILWQLPPALARWLAGKAETSLALAADVRAMFGQFAALCGPEPRNTGIRGLPPRFRLEEALLATLAGHNVRLTSELDEQGLQVAAFQRHGHVQVVSTEEVSICSPFHPHQPELGRCGAHFVGLNARSLPWLYYDRPAVDCIAEHWQRHRPALYRRVDLPFSPAAAEDSPPSS
jgi:hypothetical protein